MHTRTILLLVPPFCLCLRAFVCQIETVPSHRRCSALPPSSNPTNPQATSPNANTARQRRFSKWQKAQSLSFRLHFFFFLSCFWFFPFHLHDFKTDPFPTPWVWLTPAPPRTGLFFIPLRDTCFSRARKKKTRECSSSTNLEIPMSLTCITK